MLLRTRLQASPLDSLLLVILLSATLVNCLSLADWGLPDGASAETTGTWAVDTIAPIGPLSEAYHRFARTDDAVIYPLFHYVVLAGAFAPYVAWALLTGRLQSPGAEFPYGAVDAGSFFGALSYIAGLVSAAMACGIVLVTFMMTRELFDARAARWAAVFAACLPPIAYYGSTSNLDVPYLFWTLLALWQLVRAAHRQQLMSYVLCGLFAGLAAATKDQAAGLLLPLVLIVPALVHRARAHPHMTAATLFASLLDRRTLAAGITAVLAFALGNNLLFGGWDGFQRHLAFAEAFYEQNLVDDPRGPLARQVDTASTSGALIVQMVGYPLAALALAGLVLVVRRRHFVALILPVCSLAYYIAVVAPTTALSRYLLGIVLLALPLAAAAVAWGAAQQRTWLRTATVAVATLAIAWQVVLIAHLHSTLANDSRYAMEQWIRANVAQGTTIEAYTQARYLPRLADHYRYQVIGNAYSATSYNLRGNELTLGALELRAPAYIMVLTGVQLTGDPARIEEPEIRDYFTALLGGNAGYEVVARFETPSWLSYRQITSGTQPDTILLKRTTARGPAPVDGERS
jgi:4-amino-4-deoxy-L-arabinose transferase-like glycosyltransferase